MELSPKYVYRGPLLAVLCIESTLLAMIISGHSADTVFVRHSAGMVYVGHSASNVHVGHSAGTDYQWALC